MTRPVINVVIDFSTGASFGYPFILDSSKLDGADVLSDSPTSLVVDVSDLLDSIQTNRGRQISTEVFQTGTASVRILDQNGDFNPQNPASPYYGKLTPLRKLRISATSGSSSGYLFSGYTTDYSYRYDQAQNIGYLDITAFDAFRLFNLATVTAITGQAAGQDTGTRINKILDTVSFPNGMRTVDTGNSLTQADPATTRTALQALVNVEFSEQGAFYVNAAGNAVFKNRKNTIASAGGTPIQFNQTGGIPYKNLKFALDDKLIINQATITRIGGTAQFAQDTASVATYFPHSVSYADLVADTDATALDIAKVYVATRKDTTIRIDEMTIDLYDTSVPTATILGMDYFTNVQISNIQPDGSTITKNLQVQGITWEITPNRMLATFTTLEPITDGFIIGNSTYGVLGDDILSY